MTSCDLGAMPVEREIGISKGLVQFRRKASPESCREGALNAPVVVVLRPTRPSSLFWKSQWNPF
jgi:hypothetical protein